MILYPNCPECHQPLATEYGQNDEQLQTCDNRACAMYDNPRTPAQINHRYMEIAMTGPDHIDRHGNRFPAND